MVHNKLAHAIAVIRFFQVFMIVNILTVHVQVDAGGQLECWVSHGSRDVSYSCYTSFPLFDLHAFFTHPTLL